MLQSIIKKSAITLLLPLSLYSFEVDFNKKFTKELMADTLSTNISIRIESDKEQDISTRLNRFNEEIKDFDDVDKKLGSFTIRPSYKYSSTHTPKIIGYIGELRYTINSDNAKSIDEFITSLNKLKKQRDTSISVANLSWKVKDSTYNVALDILRLEAISWGQVYAQNLSNDIKKRCSLKNITINGYQNPRPFRTQMEVESMSMSKSTVPVPQNNRQNIIVTPNYKMECK